MVAGDPTELDERPSGAKAAALCKLSSVERSAKRFIPLGYRSAALPVEGHCYCSLAAPGIEANGGFRTRQLRSARVRRFPSVGLIVLSAVG
jgi:hypothetical protein